MSQSFGTSIWEGHTAVTGDGSAKFGAVAAVATEAPASTDEAPSIDFSTDMSTDDEETIQPSHPTHVNAPRKYVGRESNGVLSLYKDRDDHGWMTDHQYMSAADAGQALSSDSDADEENAHMRFRRMSRAVAVAFVRFLYTDSLRV